MQGSRRRSLAASHIGAFGQTLPGPGPAKVAAGGRGIGETFITEVGYKAGLFDKHTWCSISSIPTAAGTQQAVISNSAQIGTGSGFLGAIGVFAKGAPLRIIGGSYTGGNQVSGTCPPIR